MSAALDGSYPVACLRGVATISRRRGCSARRQSGRQRTTGVFRKTAARARLATAHPIEPSIVAVIATAAAPRYDRMRAREEREAETAGQAAPDLAPAFHRGRPDR